MREPVLLLDGEFKVQRANRAFEECSGSAGGDEGRYIYELGEGQWDIAELRRLLEEVLPQKRTSRDSRSSTTSPASGESGCSSMRGASNRAASRADNPGRTGGGERMTVTIPLPRSIGCGSRTSSCSRPHPRGGNARALRRSLRLAPIPYLILDGVGAIHEVNQAAAELLAERQGPPPGREATATGARGGHEVLAAYLRECGRTDAYTCELRLRNRHRSAVEPAQPTAPRHYPTVIADLLERDAAAVETQRLREAERAARAESEAKDRFIATLSHELRTPLTPVLAAVTALSKRRTSPSSLRGCCEMIRRNVMTEARLIDDLLDVTRITRGKM